MAVSDAEVGELVVVANEIRSKGRQCSIHVADVSMEDSVKKLVEDVVEQHGGLDVVSLSRSFSKDSSNAFMYLLQMVANAGLGRGNSILERNAYAFQCLSKLTICRSRRL